MGWEGTREPSSRAARAGDAEGRRTKEVKEGSKRKKVGKGEEPGSRTQEKEGTKLAREVPGKREFRT